MTLHHLLNANDIGYVCLSPRTTVSPETISGRIWTKHQQQNLLRLYPVLSGIGGHWVSPLVNYRAGLKGEPFYLTFVRRPIERYLSHYRHQKFKMGVERTFAEYLENKFFNNFQVKKIAGCEDIEKAKEVLKNQFSFVGMLEHFNESLLYLKSALGENIDLRYEVENRGEKNRATGDSVLMEYEDKIRANNRLDLELYSFVESEIFNAYRLKWQCDNALEVHLASLKDFRWSMRDRLSWKAKSLVIRRGIQILASVLSKREIKAQNLQDRTIV